MRTLLALALVLAACGSGDRAGTPAASDSPSVASSSRGPDLLAIRLPREGGIVRAFGYPRLDSLLWSSSAAVPAVERILAFDPNGGTIAAVDVRGAPFRVDLRLGTVVRESGPRLTQLSSLDGAAIYGIGQGGTVNRLTPAGSWLFKPPVPARDVVPQPDGSILVLADRARSGIVWQIFPPETRITDSATVPRGARAMGTPVGDRLYLMLDTALLGIRSRDLEPVGRVRLDRAPRSVVTTPSGDRIYAALDSARRVAVVDRYTGNIETRIELGGIPGELRMDPTGRYLLARAARGDSVWVIDIGTDRVVGAVATSWRADLPAVAPDGAIALVRGRDVVFVDGETLRPQRTVRDGARDAWLFLAWDGFRPTQSPVAQEVAAQPDPTPPDTTEAENPFEGATVPDAPPTSGAPQPPRDTAGAPVGFTIQFAALRDESAARETARRLRLDGGTPRVVSTERDGITIHRVVAGPFPTRADAERVAHASGQSFWIYEGVP